MNATVDRSRRHDATMRASAGDGCPRAGAHAHRGFTLVELMVVVAIIAILATLSLAGLAAARNRQKEDRTRSTLRKLHEIIVPHYETYARRRVALPSSGLNAPVPGEPKWQLARKYLNELRVLCAREMPDRWTDVGLGIRADGVPGGDWNVTGPMRAYAAYKLPQFNASLQDAECLAMIVLRGGVPPQEAEQFRADEIGDYDKDGAVEFWDGWARPIRYVRWWKGYPFALPGYDAMDPLRVSGTGTPPNNRPDPAVMPVLLSTWAQVTNSGSTAISAEVNFNTEFDWFPSSSGPGTTGWVSVLTTDSITVSGNTTPNVWRNTVRMWRFSNSTTRAETTNTIFASGGADDVTNLRLQER